jgi:hypothetical protein
MVVEILKVLVWPLVAAVALYLLRVPLLDLVESIARRTRKVSFHEISIELATLPELSSSWSAGAADGRQLTSAQVFDSFSQALFQELLNPAPADYAVVNLGEGQKWLTSRLFIFALVLGAARGLRAFVFLEKTASGRRRFIATATPVDIRSALAMKYPWLEEAAVRAEAAQYVLAPGSADVQGQTTFSGQLPVLFGADQQRVRSFVNQFIQNIQRKTVPPENEKLSYLAMTGSPQTWERTRWIDGELLERDLAGFLNFACCEDSPDKPESDLVEAITRREGQFVALVDSDRRFRRLVDRYGLLGRISKGRTSKQGGAESK